MDDAEYAAFEAWLLEQEAIAAQFAEEGGGEEEAVAEEEYGSGDEEIIAEWSEEPPLEDPPSDDEVVYEEPSPEDPDWLQTEDGYAWWLDPDFQPDWEQPGDEEPSNEDPWAEYPMPDEEVATEDPPVDEEDPDLVVCEPPVCPGLEEPEAPIDVIVLLPELPVGEELILVPAVMPPDWEWEWCGTEWPPVGRCEDYPEYVGPIEPACVDYPAPVTSDPVYDLA